MFLKNNLSLIEMEDSNKIKCTIRDVELKYTSKYGLRLLLKHVKTSKHVKTKSIALIDEKRN